MKKFIFLVKEVWKGKSVTRAFLDDTLHSETLSGKTIDIGGGSSADYISFMKHSQDSDFINFDIKAGANIDFEKDALPVPDNCFDTVLFLNVMEHIFNYQHIANEVVRITKPGGQIIGFVPFLMWYHPDHSDYFRYTHEALQIIFKRAGATKISIEPVAFGPGMAAAHMILQSFPRILRVPVFLPFYAFDVLYRKFRMSRVDAFALGYFFVLSK